MYKKRNMLDGLAKGFTYLGALTATFFLGIILYFIMANGLGRFNLALLTSDYHAQYFNGRPLRFEACETCERPDDLSDDILYAPQYGLGLSDTRDRGGNTVIQVTYMHPDSPLHNLVNTNNLNQPVTIAIDTVITRISYTDHPTSLTRRGAASMISDLESGATIYEVSFSTVGGGIRGSLITTLILIGLTLAMVMPLGIATAIYLCELAPINRVTSTLRSLIETLTGVPSIIYGLLGISVFVPLTIRLNLTRGPSLIAGAMTLTVILLPVVIRTTEEALKTIPKDYRLASLALGANTTQTVGKVVLPNAIPGIMTAVFLAIGRIIGESAALIFVLGTAVKDQVRIQENSTSLAVHIWSMMTDEPANIELSSTIALLILIVVLILNIGVKLTVHQLKRKTG
ncbi:MAG: phosphate ABC transporter permease PstA [Acholeplasmatales bacterium]|nr:MAG: phosphate ABC transporter permease PstA [Acholeplasmatales bacterium]